MKSRLAWIIVLCLALILVGGCAKKRSDSMPPGVTKTDAGSGQQGNVDVNWNSSELSAEQLRAQEMAKSMDDLRTRINFAFDSSELTAESRAILKRKAEILQQYPQLTLVVEGYCDERGTVEYNLALGDRRARSSFEYLKVLGVTESRMSIVSFGEEKPLDPGHDEAAWAKNRRDEFRPFE
ncbi:MAG: peptidoglycan-associated lipoprotein Pal [Desulfovibrionaceae bacterium]